MIGLTYEPDGSSKDQEFFSINEDLFNRIIATHQEKGIKLKIVGNNLDQIIKKDIWENLSNRPKNKNDTTDITHSTKRRRQKKINDDSKYSSDYFKLTVLTPYLSLDDHEK